MERQARVARFSFLEIGSDGRYPMFPVVDFSFLYYRFPFGYFHLKINDTEHWWVNNVYDSMLWLHCMLFYHALSNKEKGLFLSETLMNIIINAILGLIIFVINIQFLLYKFNFKCILAMKNEYLYFFRYVTQHWKWTMKLWISKNESNLLTNLGIKLMIIIQVHSHVRVRDNSFFFNLKLVPSFPGNKANATLLAAAGIEQGENFIELPDNIKGSWSTQILLVRRLIIALLPEFQWVLSDVFFFQLSNVKSPLFHMLISLSKKNKT